MGAAIRPPRPCVMRRIIEAAPISIHAATRGGENPAFAAIVVDANSGHLLYGKSENELRHPASITKVMTLYLLFEQLEKGRLRLDSPLVISSHAAAQAPTKLGLRPGADDRGRERHQGGRHQIGQ